jgi:small-conductance mechanosensitive channel
MGFLERLKLRAEFLNIRLFDLGDTPITLVTLITFILIVAITVIISKALQRGLARGLKMRGVTAEGTITTAKRLLHYVVLAVGVAVGLETIGINLGALFAAGAIFAIGISFAMQNIAQNFVSGMILLLERTIKPGDVLQVEGRVVKVKRMGIRATIARTLDNEEIIVPNSTLVQSSVTNYTLEDSTYRLRTTVGVVYGSDMALVKKTLEETARDVPWRLQDRDPLVLMTEFGDSSVNFDVSVWMDNPWRARRTRSDLNEAIWWALKKAGITIAFPQLDVHFDREVVDSIRPVAED